MHFLMREEVILMLYELSIAVLGSTIGMMLWTLISLTVGVIALKLWEKAKVAWKIKWKKVAFHVLAVFVIMVPLLIVTIMISTLERKTPGLAIEKQDTTKWTATDHWQVDQCKLQAVNLAVLDTHLASPADAIKHFDGCLQHAGFKTEHCDSVEEWCYKITGWQLRNAALR